MLKGITVGCGFFGNIHLEGWSRIENARIVAVVDTDQRKAEEAAERFGTAAYTDLQAALAKEPPDFVDIATRPDSHLKLAEIAAAQGCHVLCQKPIAPTMEESVKLVETCKSHNVRLMINENWRWQPWYREIKGLAESDAIGQVITITLTRHEAHALCTPPFSNQPYFVDMERFLLIESVIHLMDVARFLGGEIHGIFCDMRRVSGVTRGEDNVHLHLRLEDDIWGIIYSTRCSEPDMEDPMCDYARIEGKNGFIRLDRDGTITVKPLFKLAFKHEYEIPKVGYRGDSCRAALQHFVDCILSDEQFETEGEDYLKQVMRTVFAGYESAQTRKAIDLQFSCRKGCNGTTLKYDEIPAEEIREGAKRRFGHTDNLMIAVVDFYDGPKAQPDLPHSHPHEQVSYVAEGEILFFMNGQETRLGPGDVFVVPSGRPHSIQQLTEHIRLVDCFTPIREDFLK